MLPEKQRKNICQRKILTASTECDAARVWPLSTVSLGDYAAYPDDLWKSEPLSVALFDNIRVEHKAASGFLVIFK